ncbi:37S ribosomal protein S24, mitochondrial [Coemansia thaxteri]|uniref:37S ribosomal protein S24, mitochondrial n=1 Tax=Coemansia thaxteri TaxID=2663907 RepID=A0A9W8BLT1_9FUNG|nr:37S ribosomal protein S24, mitochondrial [Coemansia thaxteri]KAJ2009873.1 37S ribosomal protein S24, mitochondrial [Coemansia thaxteri]KAJ2474496.1 37S ribosomal protein S24, mitochondrial [Coemansia sp. RSA 2322]KAJ2485654.1 37S ribosomal protein S24, mitochondrial [Coemansia sp. RSA 2320]
MRALFSPRLCLVRAAQQARAIHVSAIQQAGRSKDNRVNFKRYASINRKEHAAIYDDQDQNYRMDMMEGWDSDDHHTYGHLLMESVRDVRRYVRQMKFEHPTLAEHAKPFRPPPTSHMLQFERSVTMGEKHLAGDRKVVLRVQVARLGLKGPALHKFVLLAGSRYNPETDELKMSESRETSSLLNKKRLADTLSALIAEARTTDDTFADVSLNFDYYDYKPKPKFPLEWLPKTQ